MISKEKISFDPTDADSLAASDFVGARLLVDDGSDPLTGGDGSSDDVSPSFQGLDSRSFNYLFDGTNFDRMRGTAGAVHINDGGNSITVDAVDLDIRDLVYTQDSITAYQGTSPWVIGDGGSSITVDAVDLDIRDLDASQDSIESWTFDGSGNAISSTSGWLDVNIAGSDIEIDVEDDKANTALLSTQKNVSTTGALLAAQLANRRFLWVQNLGLPAIYIGASGVSSSTGIRLSNGAIGEFRFGPALSLHAVTVAGMADVRLLEAS